VTDLEIRAMTAADIPEANELFRSGGWGERRGMLEWTLSVGAIRPLVGIHGGEIVAAGQAAINGPVGWVGSIFVRESLRGHGFGRAMTEAACEVIDTEGCRTQALIASHLGQPLYEKMGFRIDAMYRVYEAAPLGSPPAAPAGAVLRQMRADDIDRVCRLDARATGEDRRALLSALADRGWVLEANATGELLGFAISLLPGSGATVAVDPGAGGCLLDQLRYLASGGTMAARAAVVTTNSTGVRMLREWGWEPRFETPRMLRGPAPIWDPTLIWGLLGFAFG
jgi:GNAT superfamily N-acetyltransferase